MRHGSAPPPRRSWSTRGRSGIAPRTSARSCGGTAPGVRGPGSAPANRAPTAPGPPPVSWSQYPRAVGDALELLDEFVGLDVADGTPGHHDHVVSSPNPRPER